MSGNINFGSLTIGGKTLYFKDFDKNGDGDISESEYAQTLFENGIGEDIVEFSTVDRNKDKSVSEEEFAILEQRIKMEEALKAFIQNTVRKDSDLLDYTLQNQIIAALKEYIDEFIDLYGNKNIDKMSAKFEDSLPVKYAEIKSSVINGPKGGELPRGGEEIEELVGEVLDYFFNDYLNNIPGITLEQKNAICDELEIVSIAYADKSNEGLTFESLKAYLIDYLETTNSDVMNEVIVEYEGLTLGDYITTNEFSILKTQVVKLLKRALDNGIIIQIGDRKMDSVDKINNFIGHYSPVNAQDLVDIINSIIFLIKDQNKTRLSVLMSGESNTVDLSGVNYPHDVTPGANDSLNQYDLSQEDLTKIDNVVEDLFGRFFDLGNISQSNKVKLGRILESMAIGYMKYHKGCPESELSAWLNSWVTQVDSSVMSDLIQDWNTNVNPGNYISSNEFLIMQEKARAFLKKAVGIYKIFISIDGKTLYTAADVDEFIDKFHVNNADKLLNAMNEIVAFIEGHTNPRYQNLIDGNEYLHVSVGELNGSTDTLHYTGISDANITKINKVIDELYGEYLSEINSVEGWRKYQLGRQLEYKAISIIKSEPNLTEAQLKQRLKEYFNATDKERLGVEINSWDNLYQNIGYITNADVVKLKKSAKALLEKAIDNGIKIKINNSDLTKDGIDSILNKYNKNNIYELIDMVNSIINRVSDESLAYQILNGRDVIEIGENTPIDPEDAPVVNNYPDNMVEENNDANLMALKNNMYNQLRNWAQSYCEWNHFELTDTKFNNIFDSAWTQVYNRYVTYEYIQGEWDPDALMYNDGEEIYRYNANEVALHLTEEVKNAVMGAVSDDGVAPTSALLKGSLQSAYALLTAGSTGTTIGSIIGTAKHGVDGLCWNIYENAIKSGCNIAKAQQALESIKAFYYAALAQLSSIDWTDSFIDANQNFTYTDENGQQQTSSFRFRRSNQEGKVNEIGDLKTNGVSDCGLYVGCKRSGTFSSCRFWINIDVMTAVEKFIAFMGY